MRRGMSLRVFLTATSFLLASMLVRSTAMDVMPQPRVLVADRNCYLVQYLDGDGNLQCCRIQCEDQ